MQYATPAGYHGGPSVVYAGFWLRVVAFIIDTIILSIAGGVLGVAMQAGLSATGMDRSATALLTNLVSTIIGILYYVLQESGAKQATIGKAALGLKVTQLDGVSRISGGQATGRYFGKAISFIILCVGYFMAGWTERKQALHDIMASTLVVKA